MDKESSSMVDYWAKAPMAREQIVLFAPTLDEMLSEDHSARLLWDILDACDWTPWEAKYNGRLGQPPIHPEVMAGLIVYGLTRGIRSSRQLEYATGSNIDFMWLAEGRRIDHSTFCDFRTKFQEPLKDLFRQTCKIAMGMGLINLGEVTLDGTRVKANNGRYETLTAAKLEERLKALDEQFEQMLKEAEQADKQHAMFGLESSQHLPDELATMQQRQAKLKQALELAKEADAAREKHGTDSEKNPAQVPMTDLDSKVMPNKEGGYAPNYTPMAAADTHSGFIVYADVVPHVNEHTTLIPAVDQIEADLGKKPAAMLADGVYGTGQNIEALNERDVELFSPVKEKQPQPGNPALRDDPTQPVPLDQCDKLPINPQTKKFDKSAFIYDEEKDEYRCPQGNAMPYEQTKSSERAGSKVKFRVYRCASCSGCPLLSACTQATTKHGRQISRDEHELIREEMAKKMGTPEAKKKYAKRLHAGETPFAIIKQIIGLRQFLLRGLEKVKTEWLWACTAFNMMKLLRAVARLRAKLDQLQAEPIN